MRKNLRTERTGTNWLIIQLLNAGLDVATPFVDEGIDLFVYGQDRDGKLTFRSLQIKTTDSEGFELYKKYEKIPELFMIYIWYSNELKETKAYGMTYVH